MKQGDIAKKTVTDNKTDAESEIEKKLKQLFSLLEEMEQVVVAFSGGVDSTFLLKVAVKALGAENVLAVTSCTETYPAFEKKQAEELAADIGVNHELIFTEELENEDFTRNDRHRCYYCKYELFTQIKELARKQGYSYVLDGSNYDDRVHDYRPGMKAARELEVRSPLMEARLTKEEIRTLSRRFDLPTWDKPSFACLSSRFPYGEEITADKLKMVGRAENYLREIISGQLRVRHHDQKTARIEIEPEEFPQLINRKADIVEFLRELGYTYITLDLVGYRTGSMNEVLDDID